MSLGGYGAQLRKRRGSRSPSREEKVTIHGALGGHLRALGAFFRNFFRFFSLLGASWAFFDDFLRNFAIFGRFLVDFGQFWDGF